MGNRSVKKITEEDQDAGGGKKKTGKKQRRCYVDCCLGATIAIVVFVFIGLVCLLLGAILPELKWSCPAPPLRKGRNVSEIWRECSRIANVTAQCLGPCETAKVTAKVTDRPTTVISRPPPLPTPAAGRSSSDFRLGDSLIPGHYDIDLQPRFGAAEDENSFNGSVTIYFRCQRGIGVITLHATSLTIDEDSITLRNKNDRGSISWTRLATNSSTEMVRIYLRNSLMPGSDYILRMRFRGTLLQPSATGFYRTEYTDRDSLRYLAVSHFHVASARRAFPCFDEPSFKATFNVTLVRRTGYTALSNMPLRQTQDRGGGWEADTFEQTPRMSTYLLALVVCEFGYREIITPGGIQVRVWAQPDFLQHADFILQLTGPLLETLEAWTGIKYPLPKLDHLVVSRFPHSAMENWGLLVYSEDFALIDPRHATAEDRLLVATTVAHVIAHQWFGNLVTLDWWNNAFLNEGFATYVGQVIALRDVEPSWNAEWIFTGQMEGVLQLDSSGFSEPLRPISDVGRPDRRIDSFNDRVTYIKGGALMRMLIYLMGESSFRRGTQKYLKKYAYSTASSTDFYNTLDEQARTEGALPWNPARSLASLLDSWLDQSGFPLVNVTDLGNGTLFVTQTRFPGGRPPSPGRSDSPLNSTWDIPLTLADRTALREYGTRGRLQWIHDRTATVDAGGVVSWTLVNVLHQGYYRVVYDVTTWNGILQQLRNDHTVFPVISRTEIITDANALASSSLITELDALKATQYLRNETEAAPLLAAIRGRLPLLTTLFSRTTTNASLNTYILSLVLPSYNRLDNTSSSSVTEQLLRRAVIAESCSRGYASCVSQALRLFARFRASPDVNPIVPDYRETVYCTAAATAGTDGRGRDAVDFLKDTLLRRLGETKSSLQEVTNLIKGLSCVRDPVLISQLLEDIVSTGQVGLMVDLARQPAAQDTIWRYLNATWERLGRLVFIREALLDALTDTFATDTDLQLLLSFLEGHPSGLRAGANDTLVAKVMQNIAWMSDNRAPISQWLEDSNTNAGVRQRRSLKNDVTTTKARQRPGTEIHHQTSFYT